MTLDAAVVPVGDPVTGNVKARDANGKEITKASDQWLSGAGTPISITVQIDDKHSTTANAGDSFVISTIAAPALAAGDYTVTASYVYNGATMTATKPVALVKVKKLQYRIGNLPFQDVGGQKIYVPVGKTREFKAIPDPNGAWPVGKPVWSGSSGAGGTGETVAVTFYGLSSTATDSKSVVAECGNSVFATVIAFTVNLKRNVSRSPNDEALAPMETGKPIFIPEIPEPDSPYAGNGVEIQADISPSGLNLPLGDFGMRQQYVTVYDKRRTVNGKSQQELTMNPMVDETAAPNVLDRDGDNDGDTYFQFDTPGINMFAVQQEFNADQTLTSWTTTWDFATYPTYQGGTFTAPFRWIVTLTATRRADGTVEYS